jgi:ABC-type methionine transport system ATPase subunit
MAKAAKRVWLTFEGDRVNTPCLWKMARRFPDVSFDIRQASVKTDIGIMAVLLEGEADQIEGAIAYLRELGVIVEPVEKNVLDS